MRTLVPLVALVLIACSSGGYREGKLGEADAGLRTARDMAPIYEDMAAPRDFSRADMACDTAAGWFWCGSECVSPLGNDRHCGACNRVCPVGLSCCNTQCIQKADAFNHCGSCFNVCGASYPWCCNGVCESHRC